MSIFYARVMRALPTCVAAIVLGGIVGADVAIGECGPTAVELNLATGCVQLGEIVEVTIDLRDSIASILGGQFFVEYNPDVLAVVDVLPGDDPFTLELYENATIPGLLDYSVIAFPFPNPGTFEDTTMGYIQFEVVGDAGDPGLRFRLHDPPTPTQLATASGGGLVAETRFPRQDQPSLRDFADLQRCFGGDDEEVRAECRCRFDALSDGDVDLFDFRRVWLNWTGPADGTCP